MLMWWVWARAGFSAVEEGLVPCTGELRTGEGPLGRAVLSGEVASKRTKFCLTECI